MLGAGLQTFDERDFVVCLHISAHFDGAQIAFTVDRLEREDAKQNERAIIDVVHDTLREFMEAAEQRCGPIEEIYRKP